MKILVSSKYLANKLSKIDFENGERVQEVNLDDLIFTITTNKRSVTVEVNVISRWAIFPIKQEYRRWDCVKECLINIPDQPVTLDININHVSVKFQY